MKVKKDICEYCGSEITSNRDRANMVFFPPRKSAHLECYYKNNPQIKRRNKVAEAVKS